MVQGHFVKAELCGVSLALRVAELGERASVGYISPEKRDGLYFASALLLCTEAVVTCWALAFTECAVLGSVLSL